MLSVFPCVCAAETGAVVTLSVRINNSSPFLRAQTFRGNYALKCPWPDLAAISHPLDLSFEFQFGKCTGVSYVIQMYARAMVAKPHQLLLLTDY